MSGRAWLARIVFAAAALGAAWVLFVGLPRWYPAEGPAVSTGGADDRSAAGAQTVSTLYYVSGDGMRLVGVPRRLARRANPTAQARAILEQQLAAPPAPLVSPIPPGTGLRAVYLTGDGDAFVDLTEEIALGHSGGSREELFTVYAIVNALATNLAAVDAVQILVDGVEVDTLVGHVDLQRPLRQNLDLLEAPSDDWMPADDAPADPDRSS
ncbi:MAG: GerMN domain-containing protein [Acidobacteria bacterium]|nr:GerMN domain-containing protein [Acidobacteriota bacterium]